METVNFIGLVSSLYIAAWQQLGKIANPMTGKIEKSLEQAKYSIDLLIMLKEKTKGNLSSDEEKALNESVANLQMNYVEELSLVGKEKDKKETEAAEKTDEKKDGTDKS